MLWNLVIDNPLFDKKFCHVW